MTRAAPLTNQAVVAAVAGVAAVSSFVLPGVTITDAVSMWVGIALAFLGLAFTAIAVLRPGLARFELLVPALDVVAIGLLRFGTGDVLVTVSDGVLDLFGEDLDELAACVLAHPDPDDLIAQVEQRGRGAHPDDDVTVLAVRLEAELHRSVP